MSVLKRGIELSELVEIYIRERSCGASELKKEGIEFVIYAYHDDGYSGHGTAFMKKGDNWFYKDLGHCSCYGPWDDLNLERGFPTLEGLMRKYKEEQFYGDKLDPDFREMISIIKEQFYEGDN